MFHWSSINTFAIWKWLGSILVIHIFRFFFFFGYSFCSLNFHACSKCSMIIVSTIIVFFFVSSNGIKFFVCTGVSWFLWGIEFVFFFSFLLELGILKSLEVYLNSLCDLKLSCFNYSSIDFHRHHFWPIFRVFHLCVRCSLTLQCPIFCHYQ